MQYQFIEMEEERSHPNTALLHLVKGSEQLTVEGISIGGGKIEVVSINDYPIALSGNYPALLVFHKDTFGTIARVTTILGNNEINVSQMNVARKEKGDIALMTIELDEKIDEAVIEEVSAADGVDRVIEMKES